MSQQQIDAFMCVHQRDISYLFETVLQSYQLNFVPKGRLFLISNDKPYLDNYISETPYSNRITVMCDDEWLSKEEMSLPGWFRQQIIKLRAHLFCGTEHFCNIGADTVLLQPVNHNDLVENDLPITYYRSHVPPTIHWWYELQRVMYDARVLQVRPVRALRYVDFINDLFCFNRDTLFGLNEYLTRLHGDNAYYRLLNGLQTNPTDQKKFGEWTLYSTYILDYLRQPVSVRNASAGFLHQVHSARDLRHYRFDSKAVHFVGKGFDIDTIKRAIVQQGLALGTQLTIGPAASSIEKLPVGV